jgi:hypothetical protein
MCRMEHGDILTSVQEGTAASVPPALISGSAERPPAPAPAGTACQAGPAQLLHAGGRRLPRAAFDAGGGQQAAARLPGGSGAALPPTFFLCIQQVRRPNSIQHKLGAKLVLDDDILRHPFVSLNKSPRAHSDRRRGGGDLFNDGSSL